MRDEIKTALEERIYGQLGNQYSDVTDEQIYHLIDTALTESGLAKTINLSKRLQLRNELFHSFRGYGMISDLLEDDEISEIMINNDSHIFYEKYGVLHRYGCDFTDKKRLEDIIQKIVAYANRKVNERSPIVDARLPDGSRVNIVLPPISIDGPVITIRKFPKTSITMEQMIEGGSITEEAAWLLRKYVQDKKNIFVLGGTGSGKTTLLNVLTDQIDSNERIITIEDSAELHISHIDNLVRLEARKNDDTVDEVSIRDMIKTSLRMRPDRIIVGEVRGSEALDMLNAMNTGHEGSISTGHANSAADMLARLELMILSDYSIPLIAIQKLIATAIDVLIEVKRFSDGKRRLVGIYSVQGIAEGDYVLKEEYHYLEEPS